MDFSLDTNILIHLLRNSATSDHVVDEIFNESTPTLVISIVAKAEIESIAIQNGYGGRKLQAIHKLISEFLVIPISTDDLVARYAEIDAFSQGKHPIHKLSRGVTARNMGKNNLWIAATASITETVLLTTDGDFDHLVNSPFLQVQKVPIL